MGGRLIDRGRWIAPGREVVSEILLAKYWHPSQAWSSYTGHHRFVSAIELVQDRGDPWQLLGVTRRGKETSVPLP